MAKNIILCSDGTGNETIKNRGTNVFKLYEAVDTSLYSSPVQVAFYDDGIGTEKLRTIRTLAGATGWGLGRNIKRLYRELARVYNDGDNIYLFGFSRGAFTVRMLARMINTCGILKTHDTDFIDTDTLEKQISDLYTRFLRQSGPVDHLGLKFHKRKHIRFIGVWDTVDAVGLPKFGNWLNRIPLPWFRFKRTDCDELGDVEHACHALAIDDERAAFAPLLWDESKCKDAKNRIEQVWFAGAHSNVGGGYLRQGMSIVALDWMMAKAEEHKLRFIPEQRKDYYDRRNAADRLYDPRSGVWAFYQWKPRDIEKICKDNHSPPRIHVSVFERLALRPEGYAPGNIPTKVEVVPTYTLQHPVAATALAENEIANKCSIICTTEDSEDLSRARAILAKAKKWTTYSRPCHLFSIGLLLYIIIKVLSLVSVIVSGERTQLERTLTEAYTLPIFLILAFFVFLLPKQLVDGASARFWHKMQAVLQEPFGLSTSLTASRNSQD